MKFILGKKLGMTRKFNDKGNVIPVTILEAGPCIVTQIKTQEKDGYNAVQVGFMQAKKLNKPQKGHLKRMPPLKYLREFLVDDYKPFKEGQMIDVSNFQKKDKVRVTGISKGRGFTGVVKRHGFRGAPATHGTKHSHRAPGSIGSGFPEHVFKGMRMAGRFGGTRITVKKLEVIEVDKEKNLLAIKGAVPGTRNSLVLVKSEK